MPHKLQDDAAVSSATACLDEVREEEGPVIFSGSDELTARTTGSEKPNVDSFESTTKLVEVISSRQGNAASSDKHNSISSLQANFKSMRPKDWWQFLISCATFLPFKTETYREAIKGMLTDVRVDRVRYGGR